MVWLTNPSDTGESDQIIDGKWQGTNDGIAIFRPSTGYWYFDYNLDGVLINPSDTGEALTRSLLVTGMERAGWDRNFPTFYRELVF